MAPPTTRGEGIMFSGRLKAVRPSVSIYFTISLYLVEEFKRNLAQIFITLSDACFMLYSDGQMRSDNFFN